MTPVVHLSDVVKRYASSGDVLRGVSLTIQEGELLAIVGPSGSGKSTLLHIIGTLDRPSEGSVQVAGHETATMSDVELSALRARRIGFVFQEFFLIDGMSTVDNVANGLLYAGVPRAERRTLAIDALTRVGLNHRLDAHPATLSGGERQRVAIARALLGRPALVLADEPTGNLDSKSGDEVVHLLRELNAAGATIAVITHNHELAEALPRQVELRDGEVIADVAA